MKRLQCRYVTAVLLLKPPYGGLKYPLKLLESPIYTVLVFQGGGDGRGYRNIYKIAGGRSLFYVTGVCSPVAYCVHNSARRGVRPPTARRNARRAAWHCSSPICIARVPYTILYSQSINAIRSLGPILLVVICE
jgi:hypothetical protein